MSGQQDLLFLQVFFFAKINHMHERKNMAPAGNECYNVFFLMNFTFDLYVVIFHFLERSQPTDLKLSWVRE